MTELDKLKEELQLLKEKIDSYEEVVAFWEPTEGETAYLTDVDGSIRSSSNWGTSEVALGRGFKTEEEAEKAFELRLATQRLKKAIWKLNEGVSYPFIIGERNYYVVLFEGEVVTRHCTHTKMVPNWMYLCNLREVSELIGTHKDDLLLYLGQ